MAELDSKKDLYQDWPNEKRFDFMASVNTTKQGFYILHAIDHIRYNKDKVFEGDNAAVNQNCWVISFFQLYHFITGGAGIRKSLLSNQCFLLIVMERANF